MTDEKTPLLQDEAENESTGVPTMPAHEASKPVVNPLKKLSNAFIGAIRAILSTVFAPGYYLVACFYDDNGSFAVSMPFRYATRALTGKSKRKAKPHPVPVELGSEKNRGVQHVEGQGSGGRGPHARSHSTSSSASDDGELRPRRAIRIKTLSDQASRERGKASRQPALTVDTIKSPTNASSATKFTRYPRAPAPPRPLIPRRQPSYSIGNSLSTPLQKTLIIDLDETLIHSMAKGGRMSTGHMVEVKLQTPVGVGGNVLGPQVPILYWVNKRPHCDEFLRKVSKWFNLIIFTASVQEYADPVIDWLELERKYFSARYYRQHCTFRNGAYIKDLSHVEPDLSRVMILDNSPMSYVFHEDNAIPIEGWISDPTDNDLLHLLPLLEGLQYTTDVRSLLALRLGEVPASA